MNNDKNHSNVNTSVLTIDLEYYDTKENNTEYTCFISYKDQEISSEPFNLIQFKDHIDTVSFIDRMPKGTN